MPRFRPRLRFSLSTLLVLVTLICIWLSEQRRFVEMRNLEIMYLDDFPLAPSVIDASPHREYIRIDFPEDYQIPWLRRQLGEISVDVLWYKSIWTHVTRERRNRIEAAFPEATVTPATELPE